MGIEALLLSQVITIGGTTGQVVTKQADGSLALEDAAGGSGIGGSTGSTDNAVIRADGSGGATAQSSNLGIDDLYTASPNNVVNYVGVKAIGGTTNVGLALVPKGTGAFSLAVPDGTTAGGNARGESAIDLQTLRNAATQVSSGLRSTLVGNRNIASHTDTVSIGSNCQSTSNNSITIGVGCLSVVANAGSTSIAIGNNCNAGGSDSIAIGDGVSNSSYLTFAFGRATALDRPCSFGWSPGSFGQANQYMLGQVTTNDSATTLFLRSVFSSTDRLTLKAGVIWFCNALITGSRSDGSAVATYQRQFAIKRVGSTTSMVGTVNVVGSDEAAGTTIAITADDTNEALQINVTGVSGQTWRWNALVFALEQTYGT
jgi:hypothetical protein